MERTILTSIESKSQKPHFYSSMIAFVIFLLTLSVWGGMKWYIKTLDNTLSQLQLQLNEVSKSFHGNQVDDLVAFHDRLDSMRGQLERPVNTELVDFLSQLEKLVLPEVRIKKYEVDISKRNIKVTGVTNSFKYVAQQMTQFKADSFFINITAGGFERDEAGQIVFSFNTYF